LPTPGAEPDRLHQDGPGSTTGGGGGAHASDSEDVEPLDETVDAFRAGC